MNGRDKTIWIINQYASHLETRHWELAKSFSEQGYAVAVITSSFHHGKHEYLYDEPIKIVERLPGVRYIYLHSGPSYQNNGGKRIFNMLDFCRMFLRYQNEIARQLGRPSYIIASSAPPFVWEVGYTSAKKFRAKFIAEFRDIWPLSLIDVQGVSPNHPLVKVLNVIEKRAYRRADAIVSTMPYAWKHVTEVADVPREKIHWMANGINVKEVEEDLHSDQKLPEELEQYLAEHWCGIYIGSIVKSENVDYLLQAIAAIDDPDIYFAIVGEGNIKESMQKLAGELGLERVRFFPAINRKLIPEALSSAKLAVAAIDDKPIYEFGLSMNKLNDYLSSGIPIVFACNVNNVVKEAGHFSVPMGDTDKFAEAIKAVISLTETERTELAEKAKRLVLQDYDYPEIGKKYLKMMERLA